jgi:Spy/CpxP family protein refolding chaperone
MKRIGIVLTVVGLMSASGAMAQSSVEPGKDGGKKDRPAGAPAFHGPGGMGNPAMMPPMDYVVRRMLQDPNGAADAGVTEDQVKTLKEAMDQVQKQREEIQKRLMELDQEQRKLMEADPADEAAVMAALEKVGQARLDMEKVGIKFTLLAKKVLTPEQQAKIRESMMQRPRGRPDLGAKSGPVAPKMERPVEKSAEKPVEKAAEATPATK